VKQALALQDLAYKAALATGSALSPGEKFPREDAIALAALLKSWDTLSNRVRILRGKPLPGSRRPPATVAKSTERRPRNLPPAIGMLSSANLKTG
jgi:hypothetical protein